MSDSFNKQLISLDDAYSRLKSGHCVAIPTETVYGLAACISNERAIERVFKIKERPFFDPLIVHLSQISDVTNVVSVFPKLAEKLADQFWPGPLTMILPKAAHIHAMITSGLDTVGIRIPQHQVTLKLLAKLGEPVAAPSANKFTRTSPTSAQHVYDEFGTEVFILDGGRSEIGVESTVIGFNENFTHIYIYRPGAVTANMLSEFAPTTQSSNKASPGQLAHHYQPTKPLFILKPSEGLSITTYQNICEHFKKKHFYPSWVDLSDDPVIAARKLYSSIRTANSHSSADCLLLEYDLSRTDDLWAAITDRLSRACSNV